MEYRVVTTKDKLSEILATKYKYKDSSLFKEISETEALIVLEYRSYWGNIHSINTFFIQESIGYCDVTVFAGITSLGGLNIRTKTEVYNTFEQTLREEGIKYHSTSGDSL